MNITCRHPADILEKARILPSLDDAETSEQYEAKLTQAAEEEEVKKKEAEEAAIRQAEEDRKARIQEEYLAAIPDEIKVPPPPLFPSPQSPPPPGPWPSFCFSLDSASTGFFSHLGSSILPCESVCLLPVVKAGL